MVVVVAARSVPGNNILVLPAELVTESADGAVLAAGLEAEDTEGLGDDHALLVVVRGRNTIEGLQALQSGGTTGSLVRDHTTDGAPEHLGGSAVMPGTYVQVSDRTKYKRVSCQKAEETSWIYGLHTTTGSVVTRLLAQESLVLHCCVLC
jgi:hypothetical protein